MSISSSLNAGVAGLAANAAKLAGIADNIANSGTYGYKRLSTDFEGLVTNQDKNSGTYTAGGVQATTSRLVNERGALVATSNALDIAIAGRGMLPVMASSAMTQGDEGNKLMMTTTGSFAPDADGVVRTNSGLVLMGWPANGDGAIPFTPRDSSAGLQPVVIEANQIASEPTTKITLGMNLPATATGAGASGDILPLKVEYFGNLGMSESLDISFEPQLAALPGTLSNTWRMEIRDSALAAPGNVIGTYVLEFSDLQANGGTLLAVTPEPGSPPYDPASGSLALSVGPHGDLMTVSVGKLGDMTGLTQRSNSFSPPNISKNGFPAGSLTGVEIDENGYLQATYDTGFVRTIYQIPLVDVPNPNGLISVDNQTYKISAESGSFFLWDAGDGPTGAIAGYHREASTTDVASELTDLIQTQRAYSSNAKIIQTVDEMLQETTNIKR